MFDFSPFSKGEMLSVFFILCFLCLVRCLLPFFAVFLFLGSLFEKFFGSELLFLGVGVGLVFFWWFFAYVFALCFGGSLPKVFGKILLMSSLSFSGFVLSSFGFFVDVVFVFLGFVFVFLVFFLSREKDQVVTGHPHTHLCLLFLFFGPAAFGVSPVLAVRPASWRFFGVPFWAPRVFGISPGLELARPFRGPFLDARRQGCFLASCPWFLFFPFCFAATHFLEPA